MFKILLENCYRFWRPRPRKRRLLFKLPNLCETPCDKRLPHGFPPPIRPDLLLYSRSPLTSSRGVSAFSRYKSLRQTLPLYHRPQRKARKFQPVARFVTGRILAPGACCSLDADFRDSGKSNTVPFGSSTLFANPAGTLPVISVVQSQTNKQFKTDSYSNSPLRRKQVLFFNIFLSTSVLVSEARRTVVGLFRSLRKTCRRCHSERSEESAFRRTQTADSSSLRSSE